MRRIIILMAALAAGGCIPARETAPVVRLQMQAAEALARTSARDLAALRAATAALLEVRRETLLAGLQTRALTAAFESRTPDEIGGLSGAALAAWLSSFEAASDPAMRRDLAARLPVVRAFDAGAAELAAALETRGARTAALYADLLASTALLETYAGEEAALSALEPRAVLAELYAQELRGRIDDPEKRAAADRLAELLLGAGKGSAS